MSDRISTSDIAGSKERDDNGDVPDAPKQRSDSGNGGDAPDDRGAHADPGRSVDDVRQGSAERRERGGVEADGRDGHDALVSQSEGEKFTERWDEIQSGFVDEPRDSVKKAYELVAELMKLLAEGFASERTRLEDQWSSGDDVSTEDLRVALQRYRSFFHRLLSTST
jgi:hypothetical protein